MDSELELIIKQLIKKTSKGEVVWQKSDSPNEYILLLDVGKIIIHLYSQKNTIGMGFTKMVECSVENLRGDVVLRDYKSIGVEEGALMYDLYDAAFRSYTGKDAVIKGIMNQLESAGTIGKDDELPF